MSRRGKVPGQHRSLWRALVECQPVSEYAARRLHWGAQGHFIPGSTLAGAGQRRLRRPALRSRMSLVSQGNVAPEILLLLATARSQCSPAQIDQIRDLAARQPDWVSFVAGSTFQQTTPLAHQNLRRHALDLVPRDAMRALEARSLVAEQRNQLFADELVRITDVLQKHEIEVISYKGPTAATEFYGDLSLRMFGDMDLLVAKSDLEEVCAILEAEGYVNEWQGSERERRYNEIAEKEYCFKSGPILIEPHWSLTARRLAIDLPFEDLRARAREIGFNGSTIMTFGPEDMLVILCICGGKGGWKRIQMISDVAEAIRSTSVDWDVCFDLATTSRTARMFTLGVHLATEYLQAPTPDGALRRVDKDAGMRRLASRLLRSYSTQPKRSIWLEQGPRIFSSILFRLRDSWGDKLKYLLRTTTTPNTLHRQRFRIPNWLEWLYPLIVPVHDYILNPLWLLARRRQRSQKQPAQR